MPVFVALHNWLVILLDYEPQLYLSANRALLRVGYVVCKYFDFKRAIERLRFGQDGERIVGQYLESLRAGGRRCSTTCWAPLGRHDEPLSLGIRQGSHLGIAAVPASFGPRIRRLRLSQKP
jgi:hypothetical protein